MDDAFERLRARGDAAMDRAEDARIRRLDRTGEFQDRARVGLSGTLMVLAGALIGGSADLLSSKLIAAGSQEGEQVSLAVLGALLSLGIGVLFFMVRFVEAEGARRMAVKVAPTMIPTWRGRPYNRKAWQFWGVLCLKAMPGLLTIQTALWAVGASFYGRVLFELLR